MTSYYVISAPTTGTSLAIRAVTYELRIAAINLLATTGGGVVATAIRHESSTLSGGTSITVAPLYQGAPAASATAMVGSSLSFSGTSHTVGTAYIPPATQISSVGLITIQYHTGSTAKVNSPVTLTVAPGSVLQIGATLNGFATWCEVYFEELHLAGSY